MNDNKTNGLFSEGSTVKETLQALTDVDADEVKEIWKTSPKSFKDGVDAVQKTLDSTSGTFLKSDQYSKTKDFLKNNKLNTSSIIARSRNSVLQFPLYITQTLRVNEAHIIGKLFERVYATFVQVVLAQNPIISEDEANNLVFLNKFHTNLREAAEIVTNKYYEPIDDMDAIITESTFLRQQLTENCSVEFKVVPPSEIDKNLVLENARLMNEPLAGFMYLREAIEKEEEKAKKNVNTSSSTENTSNGTTSRIHRTLNDNEVREIAIDNANLSKDEKAVLNSSLNDLKDMAEVEAGRKPVEPKKHQFTDVNGKTADQNFAAAYAQYEKDLVDYNNKYDKALKQLKNRHDSAQDKVDKAIQSFKDDIQLGKHKDKYSIDSSGRIERIDKSNNNTNITKTSTSITPIRDELAQKAVDAPKLLRDADIKKLNGMLPFTIEATFRIRTAEKLDRDVHFIIGIKTVMHLIRSEDLVEDLPELVTGKIKSLQKVRYKTGEITFKDYFLNLKSIKADALKGIQYGKRWINTLKRLSEYNRANGSLLNKPAKLIARGNVPIPNGTLILAQPDVTMLTNRTGIDLSLISNARRLAKSLFLIAVVIVDSSAGTMRLFFPDRDTDWDVQSLASIDADVAKTDNSSLMRELNKIVNR